MLPVQPARHGVDALKIFLQNIASSFHLPRIQTEKNFKHCFIILIILETPIRFVLFYSTSERTMTTTRWKTREGEGCERQKLVRVW